MQNMSIDPNHKRAALNKEHYEEIISKEENEDVSSRTGEFVNEPQQRTSDEHSKYERTCRGEPITRVGVFD